MDKHNKVAWLIFIAVIFIISSACSLDKPLEVEDNLKPTQLPYPSNWELLLSDNFSGNNNNWGSIVAEDDLGIISSNVENGLLDVSIRSKDYGVRNSVFQSKITDLKDFFISFEVEQINLENDAYYGLEFRTNNMQGYVFIIDQKNSQYSLAYIDTEWNPIIDFTSSNVINNGKPNKIGLLMNESTISMFINDQEIAKISDSRAEQSGTFGFTVGLIDPNEKVNFSFDNLKIFGPSSTPLSTKPTQVPSIVPDTDSSQTGPASVITTVQEATGADGQKIAFESNREGSIDIYIMDMDGNSLIRLTQNQGDNRNPSWSPDGSQIVFVSNRDGNDEIYIMNSDGSQQIRLTNNTYSDEVPAWSPDGEKIVFGSERDGISDIYIMDADGSQQTQITNDPAIDYSPAWLGDGQKITFTSYREDSGVQIYVMNPDGSQMVPLTSGSDGNNFDSAWSPDGQNIAFVSDRNGGPEIYIMKTDGSSQTRLTHDSVTPMDDRVSNEHPIWSADGQQIIYFSNREGHYQIYRMDADGSHQVCLSVTPADDMNPALFPVPHFAPGTLSANLSLPTPEAKAPLPGTTELTVNLLYHSDPFTNSSTAELWLEFAFFPGQTLSGKQIESYLSDGTLEIIFPNEEIKTFPQIPSPSEMQALLNSIFENYAEGPAGPQIMITLSDLIITPAEGDYQISWYSGDLQTEEITLNWDGKTFSEVK